MEEDHPYRRLTIPGGAPIVLKPSPGKGWGCFATRAISKGSTIFAEQPWFTIEKPAEDMCEHDIQNCYDKLSPVEKMQFSSLRYNGAFPYPNKISAFLANSFAVSPEGYSPAPVDPTKEHTRHGFFPICSRVNHSCLPNSRVTAGIHILQAMEDIAKGAEITLCYWPEFDFKTTRERHIDLGLVCDCKACNPATSFHYVSDMRRRLIRGIAYLTDSRNIHGNIDSSDNPIIVDPALKSSAEQKTLSPAFLCTVSYIQALLYEAEGLRSKGLIQSYKNAAMVLALRENPNNNLAGPRVSRMAMLNARHWMGKASGIVRYMRSPGEQDILNFRATEQLFWSGDVTIEKWINMN